ncbi:MAG: hypothetical protein JWO95_3642 [Verrucomicrobiales bacterium]|nr:hypothetical protein [Verrucomicrobiales bacterium]
MNQFAAIAFCAPLDLIAAMNPDKHQQFLAPEDKRCLEAAANVGQKVPIPPDEKQRLEVLWQYQVLDTLPEQAYDDLTDLAATICEAPIALITFVDEGRQWFKAKIGVSLTEMSRNISFCGHTILEHGPLIVRDATADIRFADNPLVLCKPNIRFYAGVPLVSREGQALGTICVLDQVPRDLIETQRHALQVLARFVMLQLEQRRQAREQARMVNVEKLQMELAETRAKLAEAEQVLASRNN